MVFVCGYMLIAADVDFGEILPSTDDTKIHIKYVLTHYVCVIILYILLKGEP